MCTDWYCSLIFMIFISVYCFDLSFRKKQVQLDLCFVSFVFLLVFALCDPSDEFSIEFIVNSYVVVLSNCSRLGSDLYVLTSHFLCVHEPSQEQVIWGLSFVASVILFSFIVYFFDTNQVVSFLAWVFFKIVINGALLCGMGFAHWERQYIYL